MIEPAPASIATGKNPFAAPPPVALRELRVDRLSCRYGELTALDNLSFALAPGERVAIVGPNGCGKSTLLKLLIGHLTPAKSATPAILLNGQPLESLGRIQAARIMALVPQLAGGSSSDFSLAGGGFSVREVVLMSRYAAHLHQAGPLGRFAAMGFETEYDLQLANHAMWAMDVHHLADRPIDTLSGGERQRVTIARALAQEPALLLLDEPTSALDLYHQLELLALLDTLTTRAQRSALLVTHDLNLAARCATRILLLDQGKLIADGPPAQVLTPQTLEPVYRVKVHTVDRSLTFTRQSRPT